MKKFELTALFAAILTVILIRALVTWWSPNLMADGNFLILVIVPVCLLMGLFNLIFLMIKH